MTPNSITKTFVEQVKSLVDSGKAANQAEIVAVLNWNKSMMSEVMNSRKNVPLAVYRKFASHYGLSVPQETLVNEPGTGYEEGYKDKYIQSLERENKRLQRDLDLSLGEIRHNLLLGRSVAETNQDLLIELLAAQKKQTVESVSLRVGKSNGENYKRLKEEGSFPYVGS